MRQFVPIVLLSFSATAFAQVGEPPRGTKKLPKRTQPSLDSKVGGKANVGLIPNLKSLFEQPEELGSADFPAADRSAVTAETVRSIVYSKDGGFRGRLYQISGNKWIDSTRDQGEVGFRVSGRNGAVLSLLRFGGIGSMKINLETKQVLYQDMPFYKVISSSTGRYVPQMKELRRVYFGTESSGDRFTGEFRLVDGVWKRNGKAPFGKAEFNVKAQAKSQLELVSESGDQVVIDFLAGTLRGNGPADQIVLVGHTPRMPGAEDEFPQVSSGSTVNDNSLLSKLLGTWERKSIDVGERQFEVPTEDRDRIAFKAGGQFSWASKVDSRDGAFTLDRNQLETIDVKRANFRVVSCTKETLKLEADEQDEKIVLTYTRVKQIDPREKERGRFEKRGLALKFKVQTKNRIQEAKP